MDNPVRANGGALYGDFGNIVFEEIETLMGSIEDLRKEFKGPFPIIRGMQMEPMGSITKPTDKELESAVNSALELIPGHLEEAGMVIPGEDDLKKLQPSLVHWLKAQTTDTLDLKAAVAGEQIGLKSNYVNDTFIFSQEGEVDTLIAMRDADFSDQLAAFYIMIMDVILEVFGLILALIGFRAPKPDARALGGPMKKLLKDEGFRKAFKKLMDGLEDRDPLAILIFIQYIRSVGVFGEIAAAWFANLGWFDYVAAIGRLLAWILLATGTAGAGVLLKLGQVILSAVEFYTKIGQLSRMWDDYIKEV
ncbi:hypothetical protein WIW50_12180 [Flavobacteriaceae bacterium 3-367]